MPQQIHAQYKQRFKIVQKIYDSTTISHIVFVCSKISYIGINQQIHHLRIRRYQENQQTA